MEEDFLKTLAADTVPFGRELAIAVADRLQSGQSLGYGHRDYCGMGLNYHDGKYYYGELWDGSLDPDQSVVHTRDAFINWLALQSTATMARLDDKDIFYRGNQIITRQRLEAFTDQKFRFPD